MKVLHIHRFGLKGGAGGAISMRRLHFGLRKAGIDSNILCVREVPESCGIISCKPTNLEKKWNTLTEKITSKFGLEDVLNINSLRINKSKAYKDADIINFHRIPNVFSYLAIPSLTKNKPAVISLCEMWTLTGHCRHSMGCDHWKTGCGKCPNMHLPPAIQWDGTHFHWKMKQWAYCHSELTVVAKSRWISELARQSMLNRFPIYNIPNGIDTDVYKPLNKDECRLIFKIPANKKVLMFVAQRLDTFLKGGDLLLNVLKSLPESLKKNMVLLVFGNKGEIISNAIDIPTVNLGYVRDDKTKAMAYSAADLFLLPTRAEVFPNVALESISCGTPVVAFRVGGVPDLVRPGISGYLAAFDNTGEFAKGIIELLEDVHLYRYMSEKCREIAIKEYHFDITVKKYINLYRHVIKSRSGSQSNHCITNE